MGDLYNLKLASNIYLHDLPNMGRPQRKCICALAIIIRILVQFSKKTIILLFVLLIKKWKKNVHFGGQTHLRESNTS
jgi:hypothetical protein